MTVDKQDDSALEAALANPKIAEVVYLVHKNATLSEILGEQHTTQGFSSAEELALAFKGELETASQSDVENQMQAAKEQYAEEIEKAGITDEELRAMFEKVWIYSRLTSPKIELLEEALSKIENTEATAVFASGLAAIHAAVQQFSHSATKGENGEYVSGGKIVVVGSIYGGSYAQLMEMNEKTGRTFEHVSISEFLEKGLPADAELVMFESCNNPTLKVVPVDKIAVEAKKIGAMTICDNTFSPLSVRPAEQGVDLVVNSMTKYHNGQSEDLGGSISGKQEVIAQLLDLHKGQRMINGGVMAPRVAHEFLNHLKDLPERLYLSTQNVRQVAELAKKFGLKFRTMETDEHFPEIKNPDISDDITNGMVSVYLDSDDDAHQLVNTLIQEGVGKGAVSLGATTTYYCIPAETTHSEMSPEEQARAGITPGLVRISCGIEKDLPEKFEQVLERIAASEDVGVK